MQIQGENTSASSGFDYVNTQKPYLNRRSQVGTNYYVFVHKALQLYLHLF